MAKLQFWPMTIFQHHEERFLRRADRARTTARMQGMSWYVRVGWTRFLSPYKKKIGSPQQNLLPQINIFMHKGIARCFN
jgi:hypothetical protein